MRTRKQKCSKFEVTVRQFYKKHRDQWSFSDFSHDVVSVFRFAIGLLIEML